MNIFRCGTALRVLTVVISDMHVQNKESGISPLYLVYPRTERINIFKIAVDP